MRLDHYLATRGPKLSPGTRLELLRQVADAVRYAHSKRVIHRALAPQSVLVMDPDAEVPRLKVFNWQVGVREAEAASSATVHVQELVDRQATVYMAPEALLDPKAATEASDVFSLGAIAYHLFSGRPPGESPAEVARTLGEHNGLKVSAVLDGAGPELEELIRWSTDPDVDLRVATGGGLPQAARRRRGRADRPGHARASWTRPRPGGATAWRGASRSSGCSAGARPASRCWPGGATRSSCSRSPASPRTTPGSARRREALRNLRSEFIVGLHEVREIRGRTVLVLDKSGDETLAERLRKEGRLGLELLQRFGEDLLQAVASLERHGVAHRDIKPDNIGVRSGKQRLQLVLFDFSLSRAPAEQVQVGTHPYLDPFLSAAPAAALGPGGRAVRGRRDALRDGRRRPAPLGRRQVGPGADRRRAVGRGRAVRPGGPRRPGGLLPQGARPRPGAAVRQRRGDAPRLARAVPPGRAADGHDARRRRGRAARRAGPGRPRDARWRSWA